MNPASNVQPGSSFHQVDEYQNKGATNVGSGSSGVTQADVNKTIQNQELPPEFNKGKGKANNPEQQEAQLGMQAAQKQIKEILDNPHVSQKEKDRLKADYNAAAYTYRGKNYSAVNEMLGPLKEGIKTAQTDAKLSAALSNANMDDHQHRKHSFFGPERKGNNASFFNDLNSVGKADKASTEKFLKDAVKKIMEEHVRQGKPLTDGQNFDGVVQIGGIDDKKLHQYAYDPGTNGGLNPGPRTKPQDLQGGGTPYVKVQIAYSSSKDEIGYHGYPICKAEYDGVRKKDMNGVELTVPWPKRQEE